MRVGTHGHTGRHRRSTLPRNRACGCLAGRQEENRLALLGSERGFALNRFGFGRHSAPRFGHHKGIKPKPNDGDAGKRKERRAIACLDNHDSSERGR